MSLSIVSLYNEMNGVIEYVPLDYICPYLSVGIMTPDRLCVKVRSSYFFLIKTGKISCRMSMMLVSVGQSVMSVNTSVALCSSRVRSAGLVADMVVRSCGVKLTCYVEEHRGLGGDIISRLDKRAFASLIYSLLVFF